MEAMQRATFGGGCFWCTEAVFVELRGVHTVESGYAGGQVPNPSYDAVCSGRTGHAEVIQVTYDPAIVSYRDLLEIFFATHDPTTLNRQGGDSGTQYRSVVFYHDDAQKREAESVIAELTARHAFDARIVTEVAPLTTFYAAESYHQDYYARNGRQPYCQVVIAPKLAKFRQKYAALRKSA